MDAFGPPPTAPPVVLAYHAARRAWESIAFDPRLGGDAFGGAVYAAYVHADADLAEVLSGQGGVLVLGAFTYRLSSRGIAISRDWPDE